MEAPDPIFADPRLAVIYDDVDSDRSDLDPYVAMASEFGACSILDIGCGTGSLACRLSLDGFEVTGLDPAAASIDVARSKAGADGVRWIHGDGAAMRGLGLDASFDLAVMTGNVAQVFLDDSDWLATLSQVHRALRPRGVFVFETRDPARRAWEDWDSTDHPETVQTTVGPVETWLSLLDVSDPLVSFRQHYRFLADESNDVVTSDSTLRFRSLDELRASLTSTGFDVDDVRDAADRPGREFVLVAHSR
ncbi:MAG: class I SAM-dependent methyltransferase [Ilumatobacter sp.]